MQIDQGPGPTKTYFWKGFSTPVKYGASMVCAVHKSSMRPILAIRFGGGQPAFAATGAARLLSIRSLSLRLV